MPLKIVRNDITKMNTEAVVNTANNNPSVGTGCDYAIYKEAGYDRLLDERRKIGYVPEGEAFITPGFDLQAKYIIHAVSPLYIDGKSGEEQKLRSCYKKSLELAREKGIKSISFPLISTGGFGYPREEGFGIAVDEINRFLLGHDMLVYIVVFGKHSTALGRNLFADLESYIDQNYVDEKEAEEYVFYEDDVDYGEYTASEDKTGILKSTEPIELRSMRLGRLNAEIEKSKAEYSRKCFSKKFKSDVREVKIVREPVQESEDKKPNAPEDECIKNSIEESTERLYADNNAISRRNRFESGECFLGRIEPEKFGKSEEIFDDESEEDFSEKHEAALEERMKHLTDTFSEYLMYLIDTKKLTAPEVYKRAVVDKKVFSKIKNNPNAHPKKITAMCLCIGAKLNLDEARDLLARAGYALSPCDKTDVIFSYFIENEIYDMIELDIQLEEHGQPCLIE